MNSYLRKLVLALAGFGGLFLPERSGVAQELNRRPNILFIIADDQDASTLDAYGDKICDTPNLDKLSKEGITFTAAHHMGSWSGAVCTPSRTMIMTGRNVWRTKGLPTRTKPDEYMHEPAKHFANLTTEDPAFYSMPALLKRAGYETFRTCKWGNSYDGANRLFEQRFDKTCRSAEDEAGSKWHADHVIDYLQHRIENPGDKPFLIYLGFSHPHDARHGKPELLKKYGAIDPGPPETVNVRTPKLPVNWLPEHPFFHGHPKLRDEYRVQGVMEKRDEATVRNEKGKEFACIENIDIQVGRVLKKLKETGELENTYIFFTSDHGIAVGKHGLMGKQNLYEHSWQVPFLAKGPGIKKGSKARGNIYLMDVLPTMCDLAGIRKPRTADGYSFRPVLEGKKDQIRDVLYGVYCGGTKPGMRCVKQGNWKLIKYDMMDGQVRETQLFNLKKNPDELLREHRNPEVIALTGNKPNKKQVNLADDPKYAKKLKEMESLLLREMTGVNDPYRFWDQPRNK
ncbi:MAG: sulfatase-like hydrolase/transferase [Cytophagales bacterium]|nr:sulfatase-like hydrolase/transferase [Cytophagales bacterium]